MEIFLAALTILGLAVFEAISSIDNAVINAEVLSKMSNWARRWFLLWGMFIAVFLVRLALPLAILWIANPTLPPDRLLTSIFSDDPAIAAAMEASAPYLLTAGGVFLVFLFFHWLFLETKNFGLKTEKFFLEQGVWFYAVVAILLSIITWFAMKRDPMMGFAAVIGSTVFFIVHGFKQNAEAREKEMLEGGNSNLSDWSKIFYLEAIDATFSIDGVVGAFAYTMSVLLIMIGSGFGAILVRELTVRNIDSIKKYRYLKNGAMYSILALGTVMLLDAFGIDVPSFVTPLATFAIIGWFFFKSVKEMDKFSINLSDV